MNYNEVKTHFSALIELIKVDGEVKKSEIQLLEYFAEIKQFPISEIEAMWDEKPTFTPPKDEAGRIVLFQSFVVMAFIDTEVHEKEIHLCFELGILFGLNYFAVQNVLLKLQTAPKIAVDEQYIIKTFKSFNS